MHHLSIDLETYSSVPLAKAGAQKYIQSPDFQILLFAYSVDGAPVELIDLARGEYLPPWLVQAITSPELPTVSVDAHTNTVKVSYETGIGTQQNSGDKFKSELHYEYALEYQDTDSAAPGLTQWGGGDAWTDLPYFGGERIEAEYPEGYVPTESGSKPDSGNDKIIKGQNYPWMILSLPESGFEPLSVGT